MYPFMKYCLYIHGHGWYRKRHETVLAHLQAEPYHTCMYNLRLVFDVMDGGGLYVVTWFDCLCMFEC